jgi:hypothetical protein
MIKYTKNGIRNSLFSSLAILLLGTACSQSAAPPKTQTDTVTDVSIISYVEQEAGIDPYPVRILASTEYVRLDDGYGESDYVLFDRRSRTLFSVSHEGHSVLEIRNHPFSGSLPPDITLTEVPVAENEAPTIAGKHPLHIEYLTNGTPCYQAISVSGLLEDAVAGMSEFEMALGERQLDNMQSVPETMQTPCFLSRYAYAPGRHYTHGLPVQLWDESGFYRSLTDFQAGETVKPALFEVPGDYERILLGQ